MRATVMYGVVEAVGAEVRTAKAGDLVAKPSAYSDGTCPLCHEGLHTSCIHGGFFGTVEVAGAQAEAVRIPLADGALFVLPVGKDDALMPSLLTLTDVRGRAITRPSSPMLDLGRQSAPSRRRCGERDGRGDHARRRDGIHRRRG